MATPARTAVVAGQAATAGAVNAFLCAPTATFIYPGIAWSNQLTAGTGGVNSTGLYTAQAFTTGWGQTQIGRVWLNFSVTGTPLPIAVSVWSDAGGQPSAPLATAVSVPREFPPLNSGWVSIPMLLTVTPSTVYHLVTAPVGDGSDYFTMNKSNQTSGAHTSSDGVTWTAQSYGLLYDVLDNAVGSRQITHVSESSGARWNWLLLDSTGRVSALWEYSAGPTPGGYLVSTRTFTYSSAASGILLGVS